MDAVADAANYVSRTLRVIVESDGDSDDELLVAKLFCAVADSDCLLISDLVSNTIAQRTSFQRVVFATTPFNILHFTALASPQTMELIFSFEPHLEKITPLDVNAESKSPAAAKGATPLHLAAARGSFAAVKMLVASGSSVRAARQRGITVLHDAITAARNEIYPHENTDDRQAAIEKVEAPSPLLRTRSNLSTAKPPPSESGSGGGVEKAHSFRGAGAASTMGSTAMAGTKSGLLAVAAVSAFKALRAEGIHANKADGRKGRNATERANMCRHQTFLICVLLIGKGADPALASLPLCPMTPSKMHILTMAKEEVRDRMQQKKGMGLQVVERRQVARRLQELALPSHDLAICKVIKKRSEELHQHRAAQIEQFAERSKHVEAPMQLCTGQYVTIPRSVPYARLSADAVAKRLKSIRAAGEAFRNFESSVFGSVRRPTAVTNTLLAPQEVSEETTNTGSKKRNLLLAANKDVIVGELMFAGKLRDKLANSDAAPLIDIVGVKVAPCDGNCDGTFFGDGFPYFNVPERCGLFVPLADVTLIVSRVDEEVARHRLKKDSKQGHRSLPPSSHTFSGTSSKALVPASNMEDEGSAHLDRSLMLHRDMWRMINARRKQQKEQLGFHWNDAEAQKHVRETT